MVEWIPVCVSLLSAALAVPSARLCLRRLKQTREERNQSEEAADQAKLAAKMARVYFSVQAVMHGDWGHLTKSRRIRELLVRKASSGDAIIADDTAKVLGETGGHAQMWTWFEAEGLVRVIRGEGEGLEARVLPAYKEAIVEAFSP